MPDQNKPKQPVKKPRDKIKYGSTSETGKSLLNNVSSYFLGTDNDALEPSYYKPGSSKDPNAKYYTYKYLREDVLEDLISDKLSGNIKHFQDNMKKSKKDYKAAYYDGKSFDSYYKYLQGAEKKYATQGNSINLGKFKTDAGEDENGRYISVYDKYDWNIFENLGMKGNSHEIYDRIYEKDWNDYSKQKETQMKKDKRVKLAFGGKPVDIDFPSESLAKIRKNSEQALYESMTDPTVAGLRGLGATLQKTGMSMVGQGFAGAGDMSGMSGFFQDNFGEISSIINGAQIASTFATGGRAGKVPINAEGGEVIEVPGGMPQELVGPSHAGGGIDLDVPSGTEVYSDRLKGQDGNTMADRKKSREKEIARMEKLLLKDPTNKTLKNTINKIKSNNDFLDKKDISQMEFVRQLTGAVQTMATGGYIYPDGTDPYDEILANDYDPIAITNPFNNVSIPIPELGSSMYYTPNVSTPQRSQGLGLGDLFGNITTGDMLGLAGNVIGAFGPLKNTLRQRAGDIPEENFYKNFGQNALNVIQDQYGVLDGIRDNQFQNAELSRNATIRRNNNSTRGINTQRALNMATDTAFNKVQGDIASGFAGQKLGIMGQEANQLNAIDQATMKGEEDRAEREVRNRDNFFSNMSRDLANLGTGISTIGKNINNIKTRNTTEDLMEGLYNNFYFDTNTGKWIYRNNSKPVVEDNTNKLNIRK